MLPLDEAQKFLRVIWALNHAIEACSKEMAVRLGVTFRQRTVIRLVGRFPGVAAGQLADTLHVDRGTLSTILSRLEERGLLVRRQDPHDRRRVLVELTPKGRLLDTPAEKTVESAVRRVLRTVPAETMQGTESSLMRLVHSLERDLAKRRGRPAAHTIEG